MGQACQAIKRFCAGLVSRRNSSGIWQPGGTWQSADSFGALGSDRSAKSSGKSRPRTSVELGQKFPDHWNRSPNAVDNSSFISARAVSLASRPSAEATNPHGASLVSEASLCFVCQEPLGLGGYVSINKVDDDDADDEGAEVRLHSQCFVCCHDGKPIEERHAWRDGCIYCEEHLIEVFFPRCAGCSKKVMPGEKLVRALDETWHDYCFVCVKCHQPLGCAGPEGSFDFHYFNGSIYCEKDYEEHCCDKCAECGFPITDRRLTADGHCWHEECFTCFECGISLSGVPRGKLSLDGHINLCLEHLSEFSGLSETEVRTTKSTKIEREDMKTALKSFVIERVETFSSGVSYGEALSLGIKHALREQAKKVAFQPSEKEVRPGCFQAHDQYELQRRHGDQETFDFEAFAPAVFQDLRETAFRMSEEEYIRSVSLHPLTGGTAGEGKSGSLFFFSWDKRIIVKTVEKVEAPFFRKCLSDYYEYLVGTPYGNGHLSQPKAPQQSDGATASLLCRFLGFYSIKFSEEKVVRVIVIENVFPPDIKPQEIYDLKGVLGKKRLVTEEEQKAGTKVLKDRNILNRAFSIDEGTSSGIVSILKQDTRFLYERDRIDYSLLFGVVHTGDVIERLNGVTTQWPTREGNGVESKGDDFKEVLFMGIIDILQPYTAKKKMEGFLKRQEHRAKVGWGFLRMRNDTARRTTRKTQTGGREHVDSEHVEDSMVDVDHAVSAAHPVDYASRFVQFIEAVLTEEGGATG